MHPNHLRIVKGMFAVAVFVLAAKLIIVAKDMAVAWRYGVSNLVDAYLLAFTICTWLPQIACSVAGVVLVPRLVALKTTSEYSDFIAELNGSTLIVGFVLTALVLAFGPLIVSVISGGLDAKTQDMARDMVMKLSPLTLLITTLGIVSIRLQATENYGYSFLEAMPALGIILMIFLLPNGGAPLIIGTLIGSLVQVLVLFFMVQRIDGLSGFAFSRTSSCWNGVYHGLGIMVLGQIIMGLSIPIDQIFAARVGEGAIATLNYANRIIMLGSGIGAVVIARAVLPVLAGIAAEGEYDLGRRQALKWSLWIFIGGCIAAAVCSVLAPWLVALLFERGAFSSGDTNSTIPVLRLGLIQWPFYAAGLVMVQWFAAINKLSVLLLSAIVAIVVKIAITAFWLDTFSVSAISLGSSFMYLSSMCILLIFIGGRYNEKH